MGGEGKDDEIGDGLEQWMHKELRFCVEVRRVRNLLSEQMAQRANINKVSYGVYEEATASTNEFHGAVRKASRWRSARISTRSSGIYEWVTARINGFHGSVRKYRVAKTHRMPYLYRSFSAEEPYN